MVRRRIACAVLGATVVCMPALAGAQAFRSGPTFSLGGTTSPVELPDIAYDSTNNQYLQVAGKAFIEAHLLNGAGGIIRTLNVTDGSVYAQNPRVAFSPHVAGGGGYLVTWHASIGDIARVRGKVLDRNGSALTGEFDIATSATTIARSTDWTMGAPVAAATGGSQEFLVVWAGNKFSTFDILAQRVAVNGALLGANFLISGGGSDLFDRDPSVAYSPVNNTFLVGWGVYNEAGKFGTAAVRRVQAGTGGLGATRSFGGAVAVWITSLAYNTATNQFLFGWDNQTASGQYHYGLLLDTEGSQVADIKVLSAYYAAYDALDIEYNGPSGEYFLITHGQNWEDAGVTIKADGNAYDNGFLVTSTTGVNGNYNPRLATSTAEKTFLVVTASGFARTAAQFVGSNASGGGTPPPPVPSPPPGPQPGSVEARERARSDFDGDGNYDLIWQSGSTGSLSVWELLGSGVKNARFLSHKVNDTNWRVVGTGDFNGDGKPDLLWRHSTNGELVVWYQDGATLIGSDYLSTRFVPDPAWKIAGVGDFNSDGKPDLVWHHETSGWIAAWLMNGVTVIQSLLMTPYNVPDTRWKLAGVGDFNGDGHTDLVWRFENGWIVAWFMIGTTHVGTSTFIPGIVDPAWKLVGFIDANRDNKLDLVWQHSNGLVAMWYMDGLNRLQTVIVSPHVTDTNWKIVGPR